MHSNIEYAGKYYKGVGVSKKGQNGQEGVSASKKWTNSIQKGSNPKKGQIQGPKGLVHPKRVNSGPVWVGAFKTGTRYGQKGSASPKSGQKGTHDIIKGSVCPKGGKMGRKGVDASKKGMNSRPDGVGAFKNG